MPAKSTIHAILKRHGLIDEAESAKHTPYVRFEHPVPNDLWQLDFKGHFAMQDAPLPSAHPPGRSFPLQPRLASLCQRQRSTTASPLSFRRYGLPQALLMDNGSPWGNDAGQPYTRLSPSGSCSWASASGTAAPTTPRPWASSNASTARSRANCCRTPHLQRPGALPARLRRLARLLQLGASPPCSGSRHPRQQIHAQCPLLPRRPCRPSITAPTTRCAASMSPAASPFQGRRLRVGRAFTHKQVALRPTQTDGVWDVYFAIQRVKTIDLRDQNV